MHIDLTAKRILVTGGNSGLGAAMAGVFAAAGAKVAINYLANPQAAEKLADAISAPGMEAMALQADITDAHAVEAMFEKLDQRWGGLDVLINNAGIDGVSALGWGAD